MAGERYDSEIEKNATAYGYKTANLMYLLDAVREFEASDAAAELHRLYGDIKADVPGFQGVDAKIIEQHLNEHAPEWKNLFKDFQINYDTQRDKSVLGEPAKESLKKLQEAIIISTLILFSSDLWGV